MFDFIAVQVSRFLRAKLLHHLNTRRRCGNFLLDGEIVLAERLDVRNHLNENYRRFEELFFIKTEEIKKVRRDWNKRYELFYPRLYRHT